MWLEIDNTGRVLQEIPFNPTGVVSKEAISNYVEVDDSQYSKVCSNFGMDGIKFKAGILKGTKAGKHKIHKTKTVSSLANATVKFGGVSIPVSSEIRDRLIAHIVVDLFPVTVSCFAEYIILTKEDAVKLLNKILEKQNAIIAAEKEAVETPSEDEDDEEDA